MKAILLEQFGNADLLKCLDLNKPTLEPSEILVRVEACGVCSHDLINRKGYFPKTRLPMVLGHEISGVVEALAEKVEGFEIGDRVVNIQAISCGSCKMCLSGNEMLCNSRKFYGEDQFGGYAEYVKGHEKSWVHLSDSISFQEGSIIACTVGTALHAIRKSNLREGEKVLITGASGGVGIHAVQLARLFGAFVIAVTSSEDKVSFLKENGADEVIVLTGGNHAKEVKEITNGEGVDVVLEIVGSPTFDLSIRSLSKGGRLIFVGNVDGNQIQLAPGILILKELEFSGSTGCTRGELEEAIELVKNKKIKPIIGQTLPLNKAHEAHNMLEERKVYGRIVLIP